MFSCLICVHVHHYQIQLHSSILVIALTIPSMMHDALSKVICVQFPHIALSYSQEMNGRHFNLESPELPLNTLVPFQVTCQLYAPINTSLYICYIRIVPSMRISCTPIWTTKYSKLITPMCIRVHEGRQLFTIPGSNISWIYLTNLVILNIAHFAHTSKLFTGIHPFTELRFACTDIIIFRMQENCNICVTVGL